MARVLRRSPPLGTKNWPFKYILDVNRLIPFLEAESSGLSGSSRRNFMSVLR
jgi:hypothetical protein